MGKYQDTIAQVQTDCFSSLLMYEPRCLSVMIVTVTSVCFLLEASLNYQCDLLCVPLENLNFPVSNFSRGRGSAVYSVER